MKAPQLKQNILKQGFKSHALSTADMSKAELELICLCRMQKYTEEIKALQEGKGYKKKDSHIFKLDLYLEDRVFRVSI